MARISTKKHVGFVSFRFFGTDGVTLETLKWATALENMNCECFFMGGELDIDPSHSFCDEKMHFQHPEIKELHEDCFSKTIRTSAMTDKIHDLRRYFKKKIYEFIDKFQIDLLIPQNVITIPLNIPLGLAITEIIAETGIYTIAHHHDFFWERKRFLNNCVWDYLNMSYPPHLNNIEHVVINTSGKNQLALRTGISSTLIPNVMNFELGPPIQDDYIASVRKDLGINEDELFILQPTRVVQRKGIEHAIELVARINKKAALVISHASGDEGFEYQQRVKDFAELMNVKALFVSDIIKEKRGTTSDGRKIYSLYDIYPHADLVTYPSLIEGFGNAFLEAIWFRKPILVNNYSIYATDIKPKGFHVLEMDNFISNKTIKESEELLDNRELIEQQAEYNYNLAQKHYSYLNLSKQLRAVMARHFGSMKATNNHK